MPDDRSPLAGETDLTLAEIGLGLMGRVLPPAGAGEDGGSPEAAFLRAAAARLGPGPFATMPTSSDPALSRVSEALGLTPIEAVATALCLSVETGAMTGRAVAYLQAPVGGSRPTLGLLASVLAPLGDGSRGVAALATGAAVRSGLLRLSDAGPLPERDLRLPEGMVSCLCSAALSWPGLTQIAPRPDPTWPASLQSALAPVARGLAIGGGHALVMRGVARADRTEVAARLAAALGLRAALFELASTEHSGLGAFCAAAGLLAVFAAEVTPGACSDLPAMPGYSGPIVVFMGPEGAVARPDLNITEWQLPLPEAVERAALWATAFDDPALCDDLGREHLQSSGRIADICRTARAEAQLRGQAAPDITTLRSAIWAADGAGLGALAQPIKDQIPDDTMIASPALTRDLGFLLARCRAREKLTEGLGGALQARYKVGVRSLFAGPSGTGKTLAAAWLSGRLNLPLYRVDLAAVSSKYIGETEKNLSQLLAKAEEQDIVLLFDEADSLFGKRTDISDSNDRFANAQTNYLLQRIETFSGIVLLTSNAKNRFDEAFTRRIDAIVDFALPEAAERIALWRAHLGEGHSVGGPELNRLAALADIAGGHIRNVVLMAAVLARESGGAITYGHLLDGLKSEYRKLGLTVPSELLIVRGVA